MFVQAVKDLLDQGVCVDSCSPEGFRPLCIAAFWAYNNIVQQLLDRGYVTPPFEWSRSYFSTHLQWKDLLVIVNAPQP